MKKEKKVIIFGVEATMQSTVDNIQNYTRFTRYNGKVKYIK